MIEGVPFRSVSGFALASMHRDNTLLLQVSYLKLPLPFCAVLLVFDSIGS